MLLIFFFEKQRDEQEPNLGCMHFYRIDSFLINHTALKEMYEKPAPEKYNFNSKLFQMEECKKTSELAIFMEAAEERGVDYNDLIRINAVLSWQVCLVFL